MTTPRDPGKLLRDAAERHNKAADAARQLSADLAEQRRQDAGKDATVEPDASSVQ